MARCQSGVPGIIEVVALYYNKSTVPNPPKDADELLALVKSGKKIAINQNNYHNFGFLPARSAARLWMPMASAWPIRPPAWPMRCST